MLLCENEEGYRNLIALVSKAWVEGFYNKPRVDLEVLREYHEGLIALSACLAGEVQRNLARGFYPWPGAYTSLGGKRLKVLETRLAAGDGAPGEVLCADDKLTVACGGHTALELVRVQLEGKKPLTAADLLRGHPIPAGTRLGE